MSDLRVRESLERLHRVFLERPAAAKKSNPPRARRGRMDCGVK